VDPTGVFVGMDTSGIGSAIVGASNVCIVFENDPAECFVISSVCCIAPASALSTELCVEAAGSADREARMMSCALGTS
jgi:hypothetical protein